MDNEIAYRIVLGVALAAMTVIRIGYQEMMRRTLKDGITQTSESLLSLALASIGPTAGFIAGVLYVINPQWTAWTALALPDWLRWVGAPLVLIGTLLLLWSHIALGQNFAGGATLRRGHELVTWGPYRWMRHPMYTGFFMQSVAYFLLSASWFIGLAWIGGFAGIVAWRLGKEEALLIEAFGDEYREYMKRVGGLIPRLRRL